LPAALLLSSPVVSLTSGFGIIFVNREYDHDLLRQLPIHITKVQECDATGLP